MDQSLLDSLIGHEVVIDVVAPYVYLGRLAGCDMKYLVLEKADAHDLRDSATTRENYIVEARRHGVHQNRKRVLVSIAEVVSVAKLEDVIV
jgi:hypothetical protein